MCSPTPGRREDDGYSAGYDASRRAPDRDRRHAPGRVGVLRHLDRRRRAPRTGRGQRRVPPARTHDVQGHGAPQRTRHRRRDRGGRRPYQRLDVARGDGLLLQDAQGRPAARRRYPRRHRPAQPVRRGGAGARAGCRAAGNRPGNGYAGRHHLRPFPAHRLPGPGARPARAGRSGNRRQLPARPARRLSQGQLHRTAGGRGRRRQPGP